LEVKGAQLWGRRRVKRGRVGKIGSESEHGMKKKKQVWGGKQMQTL